MTSLLFALLLGVVLPPDRYCVTPLGGNATDGVYVPNVVIDVAPATGTGRGEIVTLKFPSAEQARFGARGACWKLKPAPSSEKRKNVYLVEAYAP